MLRKGHILAILVIGVSFVTVPVFAQELELKCEEVGTELIDGVCEITDYRVYHAHRITHIENFPDPEKSPQHYIDRYNTEPEYKSWFDSQFPVKSIEEIVGYRETHVEGFPDNSKSPEYYVKRLNLEDVYEQWFDKQFPSLQIYNIVGIDQNQYKKIVDSIGISESEKQAREEIPNPCANIKEPKVAPEYQGNIHLATPAYMDALREAQYQYQQQIQQCYREYQIQIDEKIKQIEMGSEPSEKEESSLGLSELRYEPVSCELGEIFDGNVCVSNAVESECDLAYLAYHTRELTYFATLFPGHEYFEKLESLEKQKQNEIDKAPWNDFEINSKYDEKRLKLTVESIMEYNSVNPRLEPLVLGMMSITTSTDDRFYYLVKIIPENFQEDPACGKRLYADFYPEFHKVNVLFYGDDGAKTFESAVEEVLMTEKVSIPSFSTKGEGGGCLIATATYGSELAPQVQQLRELRDNILLQTSSGSAFMTGFNEFYYSFSPTIADWERQNPVFKEAVKLTITPLITSLSLLNYVDMDSETEVLGYGISLILLNVGMYFVAPVGIVVLVRRKFCKNEKT